MAPTSASRGRADAGQFEMRHAFAEARYTDAAALYDSASGQVPFEATLLRARISFKTQEYPHAIALLSSPPTDLNNALEAERLMLLAVAQSRTNRFDEADEFFAHAELAGARNLFPAELPYMRGRRFLEERQPQRAREELGRIRPFKSSDARVFGDLLETGILSQEERYYDEAKLLVDLLQFIDASGQHYFEESIHALRTVSMLARELDDPSIRKFVKSRVGRQTWTEDFRAHQFQTLKAVGWCHALEGDYFNGLRYLKMAGKIAPSVPWRAMTLLDRAYLARCFGESRWSADELSEADDLLMSVRWRETLDEERVALTLAAELFAPVDSGKAAFYLAQFSELRDAMSPLVLFRYDRRLSALADYAAAVIDINLDNREAARKTLQRVWQTYDEIGYDWRAGRAALWLYDLTKDEDWYSRAQDKLKNYRGTWLWEEVEARETNLPRLTAAQTRIVRMLYEGKTTRQICEETGRAESTVQNHIKAALKAFGVPGRSGLIAEIIKRGGRLK